MGRRERKTKSRPVSVVFSILAALQVLAGGAALGDVIGETAFGLFVLVVAAVQVGMTQYVEGQTVPHADAVQYIDRKGHLTSGPGQSRRARMAAENYDSRGPNTARGPEF